MKSVLRSAFDPVPRPLSQGAQLLLVGVLIVGITVSVVEYVQSSKRTTIAADEGRPTAKVQVVLGTPVPGEPVQRPRRLAAVSSRPAAGDAADDTDTRAPAQPGASSVAPMSLQPGEGG